MQNRYVGDVGDFGKYGLLRKLCGGDSSGKQLSLGVVWYLFPDESHNADGKHVTYLNPTPRNLKRFRTCDPPLYDTLADFIGKRNRHVIHVQGRSIIPPETQFHDDYLTFDGMPNKGSKAQHDRLAHRGAWVDKGLEVTQRLDVVFFDPDNGLEVQIERHHMNGPKYVYYDELKPYVDRGQSLVIYHHTGRKGTAEEQIQVRLKELRSNLGCGDDIFALRYHRGTSRVFFIVPSDAHSTVLKQRATNMLESSCGRHFSLISDGY